MRIVSRFGRNWDEGTVSRQGVKLVWQSAGSFGDGRRVEYVEYKGESVFEDDGTGFINSGATILGGVQNPFRDVWKRVGK